MQVWRIDGMALTGKPRYCDNNVSHCHFDHYEFGVDWPGFDPPHIKFTDGD
jgi:hypothetical protein